MEIGYVTIGVVCRSRRNNGGENCGACNVSVEMGLSVSWFEGTGILERAMLTGTRIGVIQLGKRLYDVSLGSCFAKEILRAIFGYRYFRAVLPLTGYRACHMVNPGEVCVLSGIFAESTVRDFQRVVGHQGRLVVIEANPANVRKLETAFAGAENIDFVSMAVWNSRGTTQFIASAGEEQGYNRLDNLALQPFPYHMEEHPLKITVETDTLDAIVQKLSYEVVHHLNLTINGAELQALDGVAQILAANPELRIYINSEFPDPYNAVVEKLDAMGFEVYTCKIGRTVNERIQLMRIYAIHSKVARQLNENRPNVTRSHRTLGSRICR